MSLTSVINDTVTSVSLVNAQKPLPPTINNYSVGGVDDTALDPAGGQTVQINGTGFLPGATITFDGSAVAVVTYVSPNQLTFTSPAKSAGTYTIYVVNADGGTAIYIPGIIYSVLPTWTTGAGTLGSYYETQSISNTVVASGDAPITYSLFSGSLPTGASLAANGVITGTAPVDSSSTTYSFTIQATDAQLQDSTRSFSLTINTDAVTWVSPANATTYTSAVDTAIANVTLSATDAAGYAVTYSANALPTGLSLSGANISGTPTVIADSSTLLTATAATTNRTATRTINWSITVANDPYFEYNTLLIPGASTTFVDDASTNNFAVSIFGDTKPNSFNPYTPGYYSNYFDGNGDWIATSSTALNTSDFTIEFWMNAANRTDRYIFVLGSDWGDQTGVQLIQFEGSFALTSGAFNFNTMGTLPPANTWNHVAIVRSGVNTKVYVNGVSANAGIGSSATNLTATQVRICNGAGGYWPNMEGYISNLRIVKGTALYTASFTPPTQPLTAISGTSLLTCQSNRFIDNSTNNFTLTVNGNTTVNSFDPFIPNSSYSSYGSGYFDGTGDYLTVPNNAGFQFGTGDFTVEYWVNFTTTPGGSSIIPLSCWSSNSGWELYYRNNSTIAWYYNSSFLTGTTTPKPNTWYHLAVTRSSGTTRLFVNGAIEATLNSDTTNFTPSSALYIGNESGSVAPFTGYITDVRVVKGTAVYTSAFTPPTAPLTAIANTQLLTLQNNQSVNNSTFLDNSTNNFLVTRNGNTTQGTFSPYGGNWSNYFDGAGDNLGVNYASGSTLAGNFTIESWVYDLNPTGYGTVMGWRNGSSGWAGILIQRSGSNNLTVAINNNASNIVQSNGTYLGNQWNHVALVRVGTTVTLYVNGTSAGTSTVSGSFNPGSNYRVGTDPFNDVSTVQLKGYISNQRVVNGTAIYTGNFTPPTTPLTPVTNTGLLTCQSNRTLDNSTNNFTITKVGDVSVQRFSPFNPSSLTPTSYSGYFDGTGDYLTVGDQTAFEFGSGDYTVELWWFATTSADQNLIGKWDASGSEWILQWRNAGYFRWAMGGSVISDATISLPLNAWNHIAVSKSGTSLRIFLNGTQINTTATEGTISATGASLTIATAQLNSTPLYTTGYISNVRIVKGTAVYTSNFTPSTTPLTAISGTSLLTLQSPTFIDNSTNNFTITAAGNSKPTIQNPFGYTSTTTNGYTPSTIGSSGYFDGTGDYLTLPGNVAFNLSSGSWTVECWFYQTSSKQVQLISSGAARWRLDINTSQQVSWVFNTNSSVTTTNIAPLNQWNHVAVCYNGTFFMYLNGVAQSVIPGGLVPDSDNTSILYIGRNVDAGSGWDFNGYITDARITKGSAIYTSTFVLPASPLTAISGTTLLTNMTSAGIYDASMMNDMESAGDAKLSTAVTKFGSSSMYFDGTGDYLTAPASTLLTLGSGAFTIETWLYISGSQTQLYGHQVLGTYPATGNGYALVINRSNNGPLGIIWANGSPTSNIVTTNSYLNVGQWYHLAVVRTSTASNGLKIYLDGVNVATGTDATNDTVLQTLYIASQGPSGGYFPGYLDDLRITKGYARYTTNFTPPAIAFPVY